LPSVDAVTGALASVYGAEGEGVVAMETLLWYTQGAALMEIAHAALGLVRSPVAVTAMQVMSRIVALVAVVYAPSAQGTSALPFRVFSARSVLSSLFALSRCDRRIEGLEGDLDLQLPRRPLSRLVPRYFILTGFQLSGVPDS
jgi:hypothetical protein